MQLRGTIAATVLALWSGVVPIIQFAGACDTDVLFAVEQTPNGLQCNAETKLSFTGVSVFIDSGVRRGCTSACRAMIRDVQTRLPEDCYVLYYPTGFGVRPRPVRLYADVIAKYMPDCLKDETTSSPLPTPTTTAIVTPPTPTTMAPTAAPLPLATTSAPPVPTPTRTTAPTPPPTTSTSAPPPTTAAPLPTTAAPLPTTQTPAPTTNSTLSSTEEAGQVADNDTSGSLSSSFAPTNVPSLTKQPLRSPTATPKSAAAIADAGSLRWLLATMVAVVLVAQSD